MAARIPPDAVFLFCGGLIWVIAKVFPQYAFIFPGSRLVFWPLLLAGITLTIAANTSLARHKTTSLPNKNALPRATALVTTGVYKYSRNPIYLGMALLLLAWVFFLRNWLSAAGILVFVLFITWWQILPEEKALASAFGTVYSKYKKNVRRWI